MRERERDRMKNRIFDSVALCLIGVAFAFRSHARRFTIQEDPRVNSRNSIVTISVFILPRVI